MEIHVEQSVSKALEIFHSIKQEYPDAYASIADIHYFEEYNTIDFKRAFENYTLCVELVSQIYTKNGCASKTAWMYADGMDVEQNIPKALELLHSIKLDYPNAFSDIADIHYYEEYNSVDYQKAFENYTLCVNNQTISSDKYYCQNMIAILYLEGKFVEKNLEIATNILDSIKNEYSPAFLTLGNIFFYEKYDSVNYKKAFENYASCIKFKLKKNDPAYFYFLSKKSECVAMKTRFHLEGIHVKQDIEKSIEILSENKKNQFLPSDILLADVYFFKSIKIRIMKKL